MDVQELRVPESGKRRAQFELVSLMHLVLGAPSRVPAITFVDAFVGFCHFELEKISAMDPAIIFFYDFSVFLSF